MNKTICIFEDEKYLQLNPLVYVRPVYDLKCGISNLKDKIIRNYPEASVSLFCRSNISAHIKQRNTEYNVNEINSESCLFINGRVLATEESSKNISLDGNDTVYVSGDTVVAARVSGNKLETIKGKSEKVLTSNDFEGIQKEEIDVKLINYPWDLVHSNNKAIINDYSVLTRNESQNINAEIPDGVFMVNKDDIFIAEGATIAPGAVLDASDGPIYISKGATIMSNAVLLGPVFIGEKTQIKIGAKIYHDVTIGDVCKVGGEVEGSIIHSYSNKQHDGFLGHAYLGCWVNLGADTNNSDLKNNYGYIKVMINGEPVDSGSQFVGLTMGDHSKAGINTMFNTGTVVGVGCNVYGADFPPKYIPSFSWGGSESLVTYKLDKCLEVAKVVMSRRKIKLSDEGIKLLTDVFESTKEEREKFGVSS